MLHKKGQNSFAALALAQNWCSFNLCDWLDQPCRLYGVESTCREFSVLLVLEDVGCCVKAFRSNICASSITESERLIVLARPKPKVQSRS